MKLKGIVAMAFVVLVWGITFVNTRALLFDFSALEIQVIRFAMAWVALRVAEAVTQGRVTLPRRREYEMLCRHRDFDLPRLRSAVF